jgi:hypothetical protein
MGDPVQTDLVWPLADGRGSEQWGAILGPAITVRGRVAERVEAWKQACAPHKNCEPEPLLVDPGSWGCLGPAVMEDMANRRFYTVVFKAADASDTLALDGLYAAIRRHIAEEATHRSARGDHLPPRPARKVRFVEWFNGAPRCARAAF